MMPTASRPSVDEFVKRGRDRHGLPWRRDDRTAIGSDPSLFGARMRRKSRRRARRSVGSKSEPRKGPGLRGWRSPRTGTDAREVGPHQTPRTGRASRHSRRSIRENRPSLTPVWRLALISTFTRETGATRRHTTRAARMFLPWPARTLLRRGALQRRRQSKSRTCSCTDYTILTRPDAAEAHRAGCLNRPPPGIADLGEQPSRHPGRRRRAIGAPPARPPDRTSDRVAVATALAAGIDHLPICSSVASPWPRGGAPMRLEALPAGCSGPPRQSRSRSR